MTFWITPPPVFEFAGTVVHKDIPIPVMHRICRRKTEMKVRSLWIEMGIAIGFSFEEAKFLPISWRMMTGGLPL
jgi:hypothetical protein